METINIKTLTPEQLNILAHNQRVLAEYLQGQRDSIQANLVIINQEIALRSQIPPLEVTPEETAKPETEVGN